MVKGVASQSAVPVEGACMSGLFTKGFQKLKLEDGSHKIPDHVIVLKKVNQNKGNLKHSQRRPSQSKPWKMPILMMIK